MSRRRRTESDDNETFLVIRGDVDAFTSMDGYQELLADDCVYPGGGG